MKHRISHTTGISPHEPTSHTPEATQVPVQRVVYRKSELAEALGVSERSLERELAAGRFPKPDRRIGKMPLWRVETIQAWLAGGGRR